MFSNRIRRFGPTTPRQQTGQLSYALVPVACVDPAIGALYRTAYRQAFETVEKRVLRRCQVRAAKFVSVN